MQPEALAQAMLNGLLMGLVYSLIALGLTLIYGVMDIVNFAHGEFLMISMYTAYWLYVLFAMDPLVSLPICALLLFMIGVLTHKLIISRVLAAPMSAQIFATFGLMVFLQATAQFLWTANYRLIQVSLASGRLEVFKGVFVGTPQLLASVGAIVATAFIYWLIARTETGRALEATAEDKEAAALMGINTDRVFAIAWGIGAACVGIAGALLATYYYIFPNVGSIFALTAFVTVALGGFGSISGAFVAGILIGLVENWAGLFLPAFKYAIVLLVYLTVVLIRPQGLFGKW